MNPWLSVVSPRLGYCISWVAAVALVISWLAHSQASAQVPGGKVTHTVNGNKEVWRIDEPNVKQKITPYSQITFKPGDRITIEAGGCVQTGGHGRTWKRYVNPSGPNSDRLYHGLIWIPGVIGGPAATGVPPNPKRIIDYIRAGVITVPSGVDSRQLYLRLGYEDDGYGDNGYYSHDDGTENQCKGIGNAYIALTITHGGPAPSPSAAAPFDLVWDSEDDNGIPLNPKWGWQATHGACPGPEPTLCANGPFKSPCTTWQDIINFDTADICKYEQYDPTASNDPPLYGIAGHGNWAAGTYVGRIAWETHSCPCDTWCAISTGSCDDDYNFKLYPTGNAGLTSVKDNIECEFDSDETIDHFNTAWWNLLHKTVDDKSDDEVNQLLFREPDGTPQRYAIVTGLIGLEFAHHGSPELHPVWAIAIRVKDDDPADEVWAIFVRRWGNEGFCSGDQHYLTDLPNNTYTFRLPWRPGATSVSVGSSTVFKSRLGKATGPGVEWTPGQGVLVSFGIPLVGDLQALLGQEMIHGELHLQWIGGQGPAPLPDWQHCPVPAQRAKAGQLPEPEGRLGSIVAKMTADQRTELSKLTSRPEASFDEKAMRLGAVTRIQMPPKKPARPRRVQFKSVPDPKKKARSQRLLEKVHGSVAPTTGNRPNLTPIPREPPVQPRDTP